MPAPESPSSIDLTELGRRIRTLRVTKNLTQSQLAGDDLSYAYVSRIEAGQRQPTPKILDVIANRLETTVEYLLTGLEVDRGADARLTLRYVELALHSGESADALEQLTPLWETRESLGPLTAQVEWLWARCQEAAGRLADAAVVLEEIVANPRHAFWLPATVALCRCYRTSGDLGRSIDVGERALAAARERQLDGLDDGIRLLVSLVGAYYERGDLLYAEQLSQRAIARAEQVASPAARGSAYWNASIIASREGRADEAVRLADRALALFADLDETRNAALFRVQHAILVLRRDAGDAEQVVDEVEQARAALNGADGTAVDLAWCDLTSGQARLALGQLDEAERCATAALTDEAGTGLFMSAEAHVVLGRIAWARGDRDRAVGQFGQAVAALTSATADRRTAVLWCELGQLLDEAGDVTGARDAYRSSVAATGIAAATVTTPGLAVPNAR